jgi:peptidoglycan/LPS O-acetylase OafA/YrhL
LFEWLSSAYVFVGALISSILFQLSVFFIVGLENCNDFWWFNAYYFTRQSALFTLLIPFLYSNEFENVFLKSKGILSFVITWGSILSYSIYLFHMNVFHFVNSLYSDSFSDAIALLVLIAMSYFIYVAYENPLTNLRREFQ